MLPVDVSISENSTVQHKIDTKVSATKEVGQSYTVVTFYLAVAKQHIRCAGNFLNTTAK